MALADVGRQQLAALLEDDGAQHGALRQRQPLPERFEHRLLLGEQAAQGAVEIVERAFAEGRLENAAGHWNNDCACAGVLLMRAELLQDDVPEQLAAVNDSSPNTGPPDYIITDASAILALIRGAEVRE